MKKTIKMDKVVSNETFEVIINILSERQDFLKNEFDHREEHRQKTNELISKIKSEGANENQIENLIYIQNKTFEIVDKEFNEKYKVEIDNQKEIVEFLNTFTNKKWEELNFK